MNEEFTKSQNLRIEEEVAKHSIVIIPEDKLEDKVDKIITNLNGKTESTAKLRVGVTGLHKQMSEIKPLVMDHQARFEKFDAMLLLIVNLLKKIAYDVREDVLAGLRKAFVIFVCVLVLYFILYPIWNHLNPKHELPRQTITPSPSD